MNNTETPPKGSSIINYSLFIIHYSLSRGVSSGVSGWDEQKKMILQKSLSGTKLASILFILCSFQGRYQNPFYFQTVIYQRLRLLVINKAGQI